MERILECGNGENPRVGNRENPRVWKLEILIDVNYIK
jgi:hypothetical protein